MKDYIAPLVPGSIFHIYNRANGNEKLFSTPENYKYFLRQYQQYISPIVNTYCYCLLPNHFHFLVQCKEENIIEKHFLDNCKNIQTLIGFGNLSGFEKEQFLSNHISRQFSNWLNGYTQAYNKQQKRKGSLFMRPFKRVSISEERHLINVIRYIHFNPVEAGLCIQPEKWENSSYHLIISGKENSFINRSAVIEYFEDLENFVYCHNNSELV
ncbi:MAG: hypothetical protein HYU69_08100 [Bacteroidetes bacterium]|nr:hypothetical protein [Bacteroidota bacterium]